MTRSENNVNCNVLRGTELMKTVETSIECVWDISFDSIGSVRHVLSGQVRCMLMAVSKSGSGLVIVFMWLFSGSTGMPGLRAKPDPVTCEQSSFLTTSICPVLPGPHCVAVESTLPMRPPSYWGARTPGQWYVKELFTFMHSNECKPLWTDIWMIQRSSNVQCSMHNGSINIWYKTNTMAFYFGISVISEILVCHRGVCLLL